MMVFMPVVLVLTGQFCRDRIGVSQVANFWFSSHNFGKVAAIQKFQSFQNIYNGVLYGAAMLDDICYLGDFVVT